MASEGGKTPFWLYWLQDISLLLFIGVTIYAVSYLIWGIMETTNVPPFPEELKQTILGGK